MNYLISYQVQMADNAPPRFTTDARDRATEIYENIPIGMNLINSINAELFKLTFNESPADENFYCGFLLEFAKINSTERY